MVSIRNVVLGVMALGVASPALAQTAAPPTPPVMAPPRPTPKPEPSPGTPDQPAPSDASAPSETEPTESAPSEAAPSESAPSDAAPAESTPSETAPAGESAASSDNGKSTSSAWKNRPDLGPPHGFEISLRMGYATSFWGLRSTPAQDVSASAADIGDVTRGMVPFQLDLGWRIDPRWFVGVYGQYGFGLVKNEACPVGSCSAGDVRLGLEVNYHFRPLAVVDPWVGLGAGWELLHFSGPAGSVDFNGAELANLTGGVDFKIAPALGVGPFVTLSAGEFTRYPRADLVGKAVHFWLTFGLRSAFDTM
jgi:outer membrane protein